MRRKRTGEEGMLTVEAVLSLVPFILVILGIISFIDIFAVHNKIQYAMHQMGNELSAYTYFYEALGIRSADLELKKDIDKQTEPLDTTLNDLTAFLEQVGKFEDDLSGIKEGTSSVSGTIESGKETFNKGQQFANSAGSLVSDPKALLRSIVYLGIEKGEQKAKSLLLGLISNGMFEVYLDESFAKHRPMSADEYLLHYGVKDGMKGLDFGNSSFLSDDDYRMIDLVVEYDIQVYFFKLFFKDPTIHVVQRCEVPAWLDGDGVTYSK